MTSLSICIATFNRGAFIRQTIESIAAQSSQPLEIVIVDGASTDDTAAVVQECMSRLPLVRYMREAVNSGVDADYDKAVGYAKGDYCWLMTDDDLMRPDAVERIASLLAERPDFLVIDAAVRNITMSDILEKRRLGFAGRRDYGVMDADRLLADTGNALSFIGCAIIRRDIWMSRNRRAYYGSLFIHVGVMFQQPVQRAIALGEPLVDIRLGNAMWSPRAFEIWMFLWPMIIWNLSGYSANAKAKVTPREPWRNLKTLIGFRATGAYAFEQYRQFFRGLDMGLGRLPALAAAVLPGRLANFFAVTYLVARRKGNGSGLYNLTVCSRFATPLSRRIARSAVS